VGSLDDTCRVRGAHQVRAPHPAAQKVDAKVAGIALTRMEMSPWGIPFMDAAYTAP